MTWEEKIRNNLNEGVFPPQKDWNEFSLKYHRFKVVKRLKYTSVVVVTILVLGLVGYHFTQQNINRKKITTSKIQVEKSVVADNQVVPGETQEYISDNIKKNFTNEIKSNNHNTIKKINNYHNEETIVDTDNNIENNNNDKVAVEYLPKAVEKLISADFKADKVKGCGSLTVQFTPNEMSDSAIYLWEFGDGTFSNKMTPKHQYTNGNFSVSLTTKHFNSNKQNQILKKDLITVLKQPKADFSYTVSENNKLSIINLSTNYEQQQWSVDNVKYFETNPIFSFESGNHTITLLTENQWCSDSITKIIPISQKITMFTPTAFTPNGDGQNDEFKPIFNYLPDSYKLLIFDTWGKIVFSSTRVNSGWDGKINGQEPKEGIYMWKIVYQQKNNKPVEKSGQIKLIN